MVKTALADVLVVELHFLGDCFFDDYWRNIWCSYKLIV